MSESIDLVKNSTMEEVVNQMKHHNMLLQVIAGDKINEAQADLDEIHKLVQDGLGPELFEIGDQIIVPWTDIDANTTYQVPLDIVHFGEVELQDGERLPGMFLQWHFCSPYGVQFDCNEAIFYNGEGLPAGTYNFTCAQTWGKIIKDKVYQFTLTQALPAQGVLVLGRASDDSSSAPDTEPSTWRIRSYATVSDASPIEVVTLTEGSAGTSLGSWSNATKFGTTGLNNMHRSSYGYNRWSQSGIRQYLNSDQGVGLWWTPQNNYDRPPAELRTKHGFKAGFQAEFLNILKPVKVRTALNTVSDSEIGTYEDTYDMFFLPSLRNMNLQEQLANTEGDIYEYWYRATNGQKPENYVAGAAPLTYAINAQTSPQTVRLRSASRGNAYNTWYVNSSGNVSSHYATTSSRFAPVCVVC